jgi:hypothetical protein
MQFREIITAYFKKLTKRVNTMWGKVQNFNAKAGEVYLHVVSNHRPLRAAAHQLRQDKYQDMRQKTQSCFIRDSDSSPHTEVARVCVLSHHHSLMT